MIRLILVAIGVFIVWVLFLSNFSKRQKITVCVASLLICIAGLWLDLSGRTAKDDLIDVSELVDCGVSSTHSYRTNYDIEFCLRNTSSSATAKRVWMSFVALNCIAGDCDEIQTVNKDVPLSLAPETSVTLKENLNFDQVDASLETILWIAKINLVKAID